MKVIFFGLGSIGKRHLSNLQSIAIERELPLTIHALRSGKRTENDSPGVKNVYSLDEIDADYDIAFITNPTALHYQTLLDLRNKANFFFVEKPLFEMNYDLEPFIENSENYYIAAPLRYKKVMQIAESIIREEQVLHARVLCSSYLPSWRKDNYTKSYSANPKLGGGVELDVIHELDYVTHLFGIPEQHFAMFGKISPLEIQSNDTANYLLKYPNAFVEVHIDYFGKFSKRTLELITENDNIVIDFYNNNVHYGIADQIVQFEEAANDMYIKELTYFLDNVIQQKENANDLRHAASVLKIAKES